jgi:sugar (pentulose or hexulose) kinase
MIARELGCALGIDLGTSALKVVALSENGLILGTAREPYATVATYEGQAEQDCADWLKALSRAVNNIHKQRTRKLHVQAIGLTGQMPTLVVLNRGRLLRRAITWQDGRADSFASERLNSGLRDDIYRRTGVVVDGRYLAPMYGFHRRVKRRDDVILSAKDALLYALTGVAATDPSTASGYALYSLQSGAWDHQLCDFWNISADQLPSIKRSLSSLPLSSEGSKLVRCAPGTPVILGCADSAAGFYALSGSAANQGFTILTGSSTVIIKSDSRPHWDPQSRYLVTPLAGDERYGREADLLASGSARDWVQKLFAGNDAKARRLLWERARKISPGANGIFFAPYLGGGEQGVLWNPALKGILTGLTCAHAPAHIARALLEGMSFEIRRCVEVLGDAPMAPVRITGWMAENPVDLQILADILDRPVHAYKLPSASAMGAALLTGFADQKAYFSEITPSVFSPITKNTRCYDELFASYIAQFPARSADAASPTKESSRRAL